MSSSPKWSHNAGLWKSSWLGGLNMYVNPSSHCASRAQSCVVPVINSVIYMGHRKGIRCDSLICHHEWWSSSGSCWDLFYIYMHIYVKHVAVYMSPVAFQTTVDRNWMLGDIFNMEKVSYRFVFIYLQNYLYMYSFKIEHIGVCPWDYDLNVNMLTICNDIY